MSDQEDEHYNETMQAAEHAIAQNIEQYELQIAKAFDRGYRRGLRDGKEEGVWEFYYQNGQLYQKGTYKNDKRDGVWEFHNENGSLSSKTTYKDCEIINIE